LLIAGLVSGAAGLVLLIFVAVKAWLAISRGHLGTDAGQVLVAGILAVTLLSVGRSARRTGLEYLAGDRSIIRDIGRLISARRSRRRGRRP
jgi:hypothetical protein